MKYLDPIVFGKLYKTIEMALSTCASSLSQRKFSSIKTFIIDKK
jgi:hypothetical protein